MKRDFLFGVLTAGCLVGCTSTVTTFGGGTGQGGASAAQSTTDSGVSTAVGTSTSSSGGMGGSTMDSGSGPSVSSSVSSSSNGAPPKPIDCGDLVCDGNTEICCAGRQGSSCLPAGSDCMGIDVACSSSASCSSGQVCCSEGSFRSLKTVCKQDCGPGGQGGSFQLCDSPAECLNMQPCNEAFGGFKICGGGGWGG